MDMSFPSIDDVRAALSPLSLKQLEALAEASGVPFTTIYKIKRGETENPGLETLRKFMSHVAAIAAPTQVVAKARPGRKPPEPADAPAAAGDAIEIYLFGAPPVVIPKPRESERRQSKASDRANRSGEKD